MKSMRPSNYDTMRDRMEPEFAKYDQQNSAMDFMHFETIAFATIHIIERLKETMEEFQ